VESGGCILVREEGVPGKRRGLSTRNKEYEKALASN